AASTTLQRVSANLPAPPEIESEMYSDELTGTARAVCRSRAGRRPRKDSASCPECPLCDTQPRIAPRFGRQRFPGLASASQTGNRSACPVVARGFDLEL